MREEDLDTSPPASRSCRNPEEDYYAGAQVFVCIDPPNEPPPPPEAPIGAPRVTTGNCLTITISGLLLTRRYKMEDQTVRYLSKTAATPVRPTRGDIKGDLEMKLGSDSGSEATNELPADIVP